MNGTSIESNESGERPLVEVREVRKWFPLARGFAGRFAGSVRAVDGVTLSIPRGAILGLVGESGCGKSTLGRLILHLLEPTGGTVSFDGVPLSRLPRHDLRALRKRMQIVFQDPLSSLNPRLSIGSTLSEILAVHAVVPRRQRADRIALLLETVGLNAFHANRFPHEFSSGQRQRIAIARALAPEPEFLVCDEPVSSLDVSIQAQIINLLLDLRDTLQLTYLFISHDLHVVKHLADEIAVMYLGRIVEHGPVESVVASPIHPYTRALIRSVLPIDPRRRVGKPALSGDPPNPADVPPGCPFHPRCPDAYAECKTVTPVFATVGDRRTACLLYPECRPNGSEANIDRSEMSKETPDAVR
ncbi:MAG: ABC transporter ATP-binding protein [Bacteroidota bacterium]|nr:ABC transporter ATP-binding protein [Bacteroidota bacterium]